MPAEIDTTLIAIYAIVGIAVAAIGYVALGGRAIFGIKENPERIIGANIQLFSIESGGSEPPVLPPGVVSSFNDGSYHVVFAEPACVDKFMEHFAEIRARHQGYPISGASRSRLTSGAVSGIFESGKEFVALVKTL